MKTKKIGFDFGEHESVTVAEFEQIKAKLNDVEFIDATDLIKELKVMKSEQEIAAE